MSRSSEPESIRALPEGWGVEPIPLPTDNEPAWSRYLAMKWCGEAEHRLVDGSRVDVLTDDVAWECGWCKKWPEAIGQALLYAALSGRPGGVCLLLRDKPSERVYVLRCAVACAAAGLKLRTVLTR